MRWGIPKRLWSLIAALLVIGLVWAAVARTPSSSPSRQTRFLGGTQRAKSLEEARLALQQWLQERQRTGPGLERHLRQEWQKRVFMSRQPRVQELQLTNSPSQERQPAWSPDRRTIVFISNGVDSNNDGKIDAIGTRFRIWLMDPDGNNQRPAITDANWTTGDELFPAWSWDSGAIAFVLSQAGVTDIWTVNLRTGLREQRTRGERGIKKISWAPNGAEIAFEQNNNIFTFNMTTGAKRQLTQNLGNCRNPAYLPDGRILFESNFDPDTGQPGAFFHIWVMRGDGSQPQRLTTGRFNDTEPAAVFFNHPNSILGPSGYIAACTSDRNGNKDIFLVKETGVTTQVSPQGNRTQDFQPTVEPFPMEIPPPPQIKVERISFVSNRTGNDDIWQISSFDVFPPLLANKDGVPTLPSVTPRQVLSGDTVTIKAQVIDPESGVDRVFAIVKSADDPLFLWSFFNQGFTAQASGGNPGDQAWIPHEVDWKIVDPNTGELVDTLQLQVNARIDFDRYLQLLEQRGIPLFDDGDRVNHGDERAGDGIFSNKWKVPPVNSPRALQGGVDFYVDIIPIDKAGNYPQAVADIAFGGYPWAAFFANDGVPLPLLPFDPGQLPWTQLFPQIIVGYDNITGFTSKPFTTTNYVLFVSDYACGQKWTRSRAAFLGNVSVGFYFVYWNLPGIPAEAYYFDLLPEHRVDGDIANFRIIPSGQKVNAAVRIPPLLRRQVDVWRTLCRGPIPDEILGFYLPRRFTDPMLGVERLHAEKCVIWCAPYTGNLWVDRGTLEDPVTQGKLTRFLQQSGRLFISSGQDLGWSLTLNGSVPNEFLTNMLRARFSRVVAGFYGDYALDLISIYAGQRHNLQGPGDTLASGVHNWGNLVFNEDFLQCSPPSVIDPDQERHGTAAGIELLGFAYPDTFDPPEIPSFSGDGCENALVMDTVELGAGALEVYHYLQGGNIAGVQFRDPATDYRVVTFFFPYEALNTGFRDCTVGNVTFIVATYFRATLMHFIMDFLRTGAIEGKVVDTQGNPLEGVTVRAQVGSLQTNPIVLGSGVSQKDGFYTVIGLNSGVYDLDASVPGFQATRLLRTTSEGAQLPPDNALTFVSPLNDFRMTKLEPGAMSGKVTELDGTTPIFQATVKAELVGDEQGNPIPPPKGFPTVYTATTKPDGTYRLEGLLNGTYKVTASAPRHTSVTKTGIVVRPGLETTGVDFALPGEPGTIAGRVIDAQTNQGIAGALVEVLTTDKSATTDAQGNFTIPQVPVGTYTVQASAPNYKPGSVSGVVVPTAGTVTVTIALARAQPGSISGRVTRPDGTAVGGVTVEVVQPATGEVVASGVTEDQFTTVDTYRRNYLIANVPLGTYNVRVVAPGFTATPSQVTGVLVQEATETQNINFTLRAQFTFPRGVSLISIPYDYTGTGITPDRLLGTDRIVTWVTDPSLTDPASGFRGGQYVRFPTPPADAFQLGRGYFIRLDQSTDFTQPGTPAPTDQPFALRLDRQGWWLIGNPFPFKVDWQRTRVMDLATGQTMGLRDAVLQGLLRDALFALNATATGYFTSAVLDPFRGYWVRVEGARGVLLLIDNTPIRSVAPSRLSRLGRPALPDGDGWLLPLRLEQNGETVGTVQVGMNSKASDGADVWDMPLPPSLRQWSPAWVTFGVVSGAGRGAELWLADMRSLSSRPQGWDLVVEGQQGGTMTLVWDSLNELVPSEYRLMLIDLDSGEQRYMRTSGNYTFELRDGLKRLRLIAERRSGAGLKIVGLRQQPSLRGGGVIVSFALTESAFVEARLRSLTGRMVQVIQPRRLLSSGEHRLVYDGRGVQGGLPKGLYLLEVYAQGEKGEQVRAVVPIRWR